MSYKKLYLGSSILANRLAFLLDEQGIASIVKNNKESGRLSGFGVTGDSVEVHIKEEDEQKATSVLADFKSDISDN